MTTRLTQIITDAGGKAIGDCWRTAVACLLDFDDPSDVPHFVAIDQARGDDKSTKWWTDTVDFVTQHIPDGLTFRLLTPTFPVYTEPNCAYEHVVATGPSPRGDWLHSVVVDARTGELVWDPHPSRAGLAGAPVDVAAIASVEAAA